MTASSPATPPPPLSDDPYIAAAQARILADAASSSLVWHTLVPAPEKGTKR